MITYNGIIMAKDGIWVGPKVDPYNPLNLPPNTVRVRTSDGNVPYKSTNPYIYPATYDTATLVEGTTDVYDVYKSGTSFYDLLYNSINVVEVLGANTTGITNMEEMFAHCTSLTTVPLFDTSSCTAMQVMFYADSSLTTIPLFDTSNVTNMASMFHNCFKVESGALALYQQASTQANPPTGHSGCFRYCGIDTVTGAAELAQIPDDWK